MELAGRLACMRSPWRLITRCRHESFVRSEMRCADGEVIQNEVANGFIEMRGPGEYESHVSMVKTAHEDSLIGTC